MKDLKEKTIRGSAARLVGYGARSLVRLGSLVVLAHLLDPSDFGIVAMVTVVTGVFEIFATGGLSAATVQKPEISDAEISTLFWFNVAIGLVLCLLCIAVAPILGSFYGEPNVAVILVAIAPAFVINATGVQHLALLQRHLRYFALSVIEVGSEVVAAAIAIGMAVAGFGYWAVVASVVTVPIIITIGAWIVSGWVPGRPRRIADVYTMLRFGGTITTNNLVVYVGYNFEKVLLGRYFGPEALGLYGRSYELINLPTRIINTAIGIVAFSSLARLQDEPARLKNYFLKGYSLAVSITLPAAIGCAVFADDIVEVMLGPQWSGAGTIFRLLAPTILTFSMINPLSWLLWAIGMQGRSLKIALVLSPLVICSYLIGLPYGPTGVALAFSIAMVLWLVPHLVWCLHGTTISVYELLSAAGRPLVAGAIAAMAVLILQPLLATIPLSLPRLVIGGTVMLAVYVFALLVVMKQSVFYFDVIRSLRGASSV